MINESPTQLKEAGVEELIVTDTLPLPPEAHPRFHRSSSEKDFDRLRSGELISNTTGANNTVGRQQSPKKRIPLRPSLGSVIDRFVVVLSVGQLIAQVIRRVCRQLDLEEVTEGPQANFYHTKRQGLFNSCHYSDDDA